MEPLKSSTGEMMPGSARVGALRDKHSKLRFSSDQEKIQFIFSTFDGDNDGKLSKYELRELLVTISPELRAQMDKLYHDAEESFGGNFSTLPAMSYEALYKAYQEGGGDLQADFAAVWKRYHPTEDLPLERELAVLDLSIPAHYGPTGKEEEDFEPAVDGDTQVNVLETRKGLSEVQHKGAELEMNKKLGALSRKLFEATGRVLSPGILATIKACRSSFFMGMLFNTLIAPPMRAPLVEEASDDDDGEDDDVQNTVTHHLMACTVQESEHTCRGNVASTSCDAPQGSYPRQDCLNMEHVSGCQVVTRKSLTEGDDKMSGLPAPDSGKLLFMSHRCRGMSQGHETVVELAKVAHKASMTRGVKMSYREVKCGMVTRDLMVELSSGGVPQANTGYDNPMTETPAVAQGIDPPTIEDVAVAMVNPGQLEAHACCERALAPTAIVADDFQDIMSTAVTDCGRTDLTDYQSACGYTTCSTVVSMRTALSSPSVSTQITADQGFPTFYPMGPGSVAYSSSTLTSGPSVFAGVTRPQDVFSPEEKLNIIFDCFDQDADGVLNKGELCRFLKCVKPLDMDNGYGARLAGFLGEHHLQAGGRKDQLVVALDMFKELYKESNKDVDIDFLVAFGRYPERMTRYAAAACAKRIRSQLQEDTGLPEGEAEAVAPNVALYIKDLPRVVKEIRRSRTTEQLQYRPRGSCIQESALVVSRGHIARRDLSRPSVDSCMYKINPVVLHLCLEDGSPMPEIKEHTTSLQQFTGTQGSQSLSQTCVGPDEVDRGWLTEVPSSVEPSRDTILSLAKLAANDELESLKESRWEVNDVTNEIGQAGRLIHERSLGTPDFGLGYGRVTELERRVDLLDGKVEELRGKMQQRLGQRSLHKSEDQEVTELTLVLEHAPAVQEKVNEVATEQGHRESSGGDSSWKNLQGGGVQPQQSMVKEAHTDRRRQVLSLPIQEGTERGQLVNGEKCRGKGDRHQKERLEPLEGEEAARREGEGPERCHGRGRGRRQAVDEHAGRAERRAPSHRSMEGKEGRKPRCDSAKGAEMCSSFVSSDCDSQGVQRQSKSKHQSEQSVGPRSGALKDGTSPQSSKSQGTPDAGSHDTFPDLMHHFEASAFNLTADCEVRAGLRSPIEKSPGTRGSLKGTQAMPTNLLTRDKPREAKVRVRGEQGHTFQPTAVVANDVPPAPESPNGYRRDHRNTPPLSPPSRSPQGYSSEVYPSVAAAAPTSPAVRASPAPRPSPSPSPVPRVTPGRTAEPPVPSTSNGYRLPTALQPYAEPANDNGVRINWVPPCPKSANGYRPEQMDAIIHQGKRPEFYEPAPPPLMLGPSEVFTLSPSGTNKSPIMSAFTEATRGADVPPTSNSPPVRQYRNMAPPKSAMAGASGQRTSKPGTKSPRFENANPDTPANAPRKTPRQGSVKAPGTAGSPQATSATTPRSEGASPRASKMKTTRTKET